MSFYYLTAVQGDMPVHLLETIIFKRLEYLDALLKGDNTVYNEFVIEGSVYDNVGHFMLCVISILGRNVEFSQFLQRAEVELFKRRLISLGAYDLRCFAKKLVRTIKKQEYILPCFEPLQILCQRLMLKDLAHHVCSFHKNECDNYKMQINFRHCLKFVAKREVELHNSTVSLPCGKWKEYLAILFSDNLKYRLQKVNLDAIKSDPRIMELLMSIKQNFFPKRCKDSKALLNEEVDNNLRHFPPCMLNLHQSLRRKHRLSHSQRFYYSLFLKDIGMPVEEAVIFWRTEYKQTPNGRHSCCHNWEKDEKKYLYGIRHMYGLEGGRKSYTSLNCQRIQSIDNACTEGGCPFKTFDDSKMMSLLKNPSEQLVSQIYEFKSRNQFTESCLLYLNDTVKTAICDNFSYNFSPVKYYSISLENEMKYD